MVSMESFGAFLMPLQRMVGPWMVGVVGSIAAATALPTPVQAQACGTAVTYYFNTITNEPAAAEWTGANGAGAQNDQGELRFELPLTAALIRDLSASLRGGCDQRVFQTSSGQIYSAGLSSGAYKARIEVLGQRPGTRINRSFLSNPVFDSGTCIRATPGPQTPDCVSGGVIHSHDLLLDRSQLSSALADALSRPRQANNDIIVIQVMSIARAQVSGTGGGNSAGVIYRHDGVTPSLVINR
jgi:hypothetical protein